MTATKQFVLLSLDKAEERNGSGTVNTRFYAEGQMILTTKYFYSIDHLASVREMTDGTGVIRAQYDYDLNGRVISLQQSTASDFQFAGNYNHSRSGLGLASFRGYSSALGRFINRDPSGEQVGSNLFAYTDNQFVSDTDPSGLDCDSDCAIVFLGLNTVAAGLIIPGQPVIEKKFVTQGGDVSPRTSYWSKWLGKGKAMPPIFGRTRPIPTPAGSLFNLKWHSSRNLGRIVARWLPYIGWTLTGLSLIDYFKCSADCIKRGSSQTDPESLTTVIWAYPGNSPPDDGSGPLKWCPGSYTAFNRPYGAGPEWGSGAGGHWE